MPPEPYQAKPETGELWFAYLDPMRGTEQAGNRPVVVISSQALNAATSNRLVLTVPLTRTERGWLMHIPVYHRGVTSWAKCEQVRAISVGRLRHRRGSVTAETLEALRDAVRMLLRD